MKNAYEVRGDVTAIFIDSPTFGKFETLISTNKLDKAKEFPYSWRVLPHRGDKIFYIRGNMPLGNRKTRSIALHRWITEAPGDLVVDHIDHDTLNNTDDNLRIITGQQNHQNRKGAYSNSVSGVRGVSWFSGTSKWRARIKVNYKEKNLGYFDTIEEAENAVIEARRRYMPYSQEALAN